MPAKLSRPMQRRIRDLYREGAKKKEIARQLGISRDSVSKYCGGVDQETGLLEAPAVLFSETEVRLLQGLVQLLRKVRCSKCDWAIWFLAGTVAMDCPACGHPWVRDGWKVRKVSTGRN